MKTVTRFSLISLTFVLGFLLLSGCSEKGVEVQTGTVAGRVLSLTTYRPVALAEVECAGVTAYSGNDGRYELIGVPLGEQLLTVKKTNFENYTETVSVGVNTTIDVHIKSASGSGGGGEVEG